jgi:hypothetical protein
MDGALPPIADLIPTRSGAKTLPESKTKAAAKAEREDQ